MSLRTPREREVKACRTCAKARVKCELGSRGEKCKRCERLGKQCQNQVPGAHSSSLKRPHATHEAILRLESKVDTVSEFLSLSDNVPSVSALTLLDQMIPPTGQEAVSMLTLFRVSMAPLFPFVPLHENINSAQLRREKPALYMSIILVASQSNQSQQLNIARMLRYEISQAVLVRGEKSVQLLQALLILIAWNHAHIELGSQLINYEYILSAMLSELGFDKEASVRSKTSAGALGSLGQDEHMEKARTFEERRVFLGLCWTNSITKTCLKDITPIRFNRYAFQCCKLLESAAKYPSDIYLVRLVRIQQEIDKIRDMLYSEDSMPMLGISMPLLIGVSSLEKELETLEIPLPTESTETSLLSMTHQSAKLYLYKIALDDRLFHSLVHSKDSNTTRYSMFRMGLLTSCLSAIHSLISLFFALSTDAVLSLPYQHWGQMGHALLILTRLSEVKHGEWDATYMSSVLDMRATYRNFANKIEDVMVAGKGQMPPRNLPAIFESMVVRLRELGGSVEWDASLSRAVEFGPDDEAVQDLFFDFLDMDQFL